MPRDSKNEMFIVGRNYLAARLQRCHDASKKFIVIENFLFQTPDFEPLYDLAI